jgi:hypothetical protein
MTFVIRQRLRAATVFLICLLTLLFAGQAMAQANGNKATFPTNFNEYILYSTQDRGSSKTEAYATRETIEHAKTGKPMPYGTQVVLAVWRDYKLATYFVMEKGVDWGDGFPEGERTGNWHFQEFDLAGNVQRSAFAERCQSCHGSQSSSEFMFLSRQLRAFVP